MIKHEREYNSLMPGLFIEIREHCISVYGSRYSTTSLASIYFDKVVIDGNYLNIILFNDKKEIVSIIEHAVRILDRR